MLREYHECCKQVKQAVFNARKSFEQIKFNQRCTDCKEFYKYIDSKTKHKSRVQNLVLPNEIVTNNARKAQVLSEQYSSVFSRDNNFTPEVPELNLNSYLYDFTVNENDIVMAIRSVNPSSSPGPDMIHQDL